MRVLRELGPLISIASAVLTLFGITLGALYYSFSRVEKQAVFETKTTTTLEEFRTHLKAIDESLASVELRRISEGPVNPGSLLAATNLVAQAQTASLKLPTDLVEQTGQKFVAVADREPDAWTATIAFVKYKSFINGTSSAVPVLDPSGAVTTYQYAYPDGYQPPVLHTMGLVPKESAAQLDLLGQDHNSGRSLGNAYIFADGGGLSLDGMNLRNVVIRGAHVVYKGGPLQLRNVYFVDCTFDVRINRNAQSFALAALSPGPSTSFSADDGKPSTAQGAKLVDLSPEIRHT